MKPNPPTGKVQRGLVRSGVLMSVGALVPVLLGPAAGAAPDPRSPAATSVSALAPITADDGARVIQENWIDARTVDLVISSPALGFAAPVRVLLPRDWSPDAERTWPVLYLLHGCCEEADYQAWDRYTDLRSFTADKDVLTVLPSDGPAGFYTRWWNFGRGGPDWERFHVEELREVLERGFRAGQRRAVAGVSIGGYGAVTYAYRHPGMFGAAASYSGPLNTLQPGVPGVIEGILVREHENLLRLWGDPVLQRRLWSRYNPFDHVEQLSGVELYVSCGNGLPGPLDPPGRIPDPIEPSALATSRVFTERLQHAGIPVTTDYYGDGTHHWPYWGRELHRSWPVLARALGVPA